MVNSFENDSAYISMEWLLRIVRGHGLQVKHLLKVTRKGANPKTHMVALLPNNMYVCDCCMGMNLGLPCRHYFQVLSIIKHFEFDITVIKAWYIL